MKLYIYGAKSIALGICKAVQMLYPEHKVQGFLVTSAMGNPASLADLPVYEVATFALRTIEKEACHILIAVPENVHSQIIKTLEEFNIRNYTCITSQIEKYLMENYYIRMGQFVSLHKKEYPEKNGIPDGVDTIDNIPSIEVYVAKFYKDAQLSGECSMPSWTRPIQVGAQLTDIRVAESVDSDGENISAKNVNYCELTALYWMWKNKLFNTATDVKEYYGLFHYRRMLDISETDLNDIKIKNVDAILPFPMLHEPNAYEHHTRYVKDSDWQAMLQALKELQPVYYEAMDAIFSKPYFYNYNMIIAKKQVLADYCAWLFPILKRTEELSEPKGWERADRYIGYLGENLMTLYFMYHKDDLNIVHTGRIMLT